MKLIDTTTGKEIRPGDPVTTFRGEKGILRNFRSGFSPDTTGRVGIDNPDGSFMGEFYPSVINAQIVSDDEVSAPNASREKGLIRAVLIDAYSQTISEIEFNPKLPEFRKLLKCDCITTGYRFANGDILFVDDEGLLKNPTHFFRIPGIDYDFAGNGIIVGTDPNTDGDEVDAKTRAKFLGVFFHAFVETVDALNNALALKDTEEGSNR